VSELVAAPRCPSLYTCVAATSFFLASGAHLGSREVKVFVLEMLMIIGFDRMR